MAAETETASKVTLEPRIPLARAATYLGLSKWTLRSWARQGRIASYQIGKNFSFAQSELERVIRESERPRIVTSRRPPIT